MSHENKEELFREVCVQNNWRRTAQRYAVFEYIVDNVTHPTVEEVWRQVREKLPLISLDSVYRILDEFSGIKLVRRFENSRMVRYDPNLARHDHFVCSRCGRIFDFDCGALGGLPQKCERLGTAVSHEVTVWGVCEECQAKEHAQ